MLKKFLKYTFNSTDSSEDALMKINALHIRRYFCFKAYKTEEPDFNTEFPIYCRASTLENIKKSMSYYMPLCSIPWDSVPLRGNPTKSQEVNELIRVIKRHEVRGEGAPPQHCRALKFW